MEEGEDGFKLRNVFWFLGESLDRGCENSACV